MDMAPILVKSAMPPVDPGGGSSMFPAQEPYSTLAEVRNPMNDDPDHAARLEDPKVSGRLQRRVSAILAADVVGFSSLMRQNEERTLEVLDELLGILRHQVDERHGRVFGGAGDSLLAEFSSPVQAVRCAVEAQRIIGQRNASVPHSELMQFRIGINMGEVLVTDDDLQGTSVNLAVRIEGLADPGGIAVSDAVHRQVLGRVSVTFDDMGEQRVKGFSSGVRTYRVGFGDMPPEIGSVSVTAGEGADHDLGITDDLRRLPARPVILVLPFSNLSGDAVQDYFCHGLTQDITTELSRFSSLSIISSTTALAYAGKAVLEAFRDLSARYVLEGSVQKTDERLRINVQFIEAPSDKHIWVKRFDRASSDLFALQDEIIENVVAALALKVEAEERQRAMRKATVNLNAYDAFLKGSYLWLQHSISDETRKSLLDARRWLRKATALDPKYGRAWAWLSLTHMQEWLRAWGGRSALDQAGRLARKAITIDAADYNIHWILAYYYLHSRQFEHALSEYETALSLNPNDANLLAEVAEAWVYSGEPQKGIEMTRQAMRMNPHFSEWYRVDLAWVSYLVKDYELAVHEVQRLSAPNVDAHLILAASSAQLAAAQHNREKASSMTAVAQGALQRALKRRSRWTLSKEHEKAPFRQASDLDHWLDGLRRAGLPE